MTLRIAATPRIHRRSSLTVMSSPKEIELAGRKPVTKRCASPKLNGHPMSAAWSAVSTPRVATSRVSGEAFQSQCITSRWTSAPEIAATVTPTATAPAVPQPASSASTYANAPTAAMAPCAKFRTPEPR